MNERGDLLSERAAAGIHAEVGRFILERFPQSAAILDLGAGTGAFVQRLRHLGYRNLTAAEIDTSQYQADVPVVRVDLNSEFAHCFLERFDLALAIEVLEQLENPTQFLRQCAAILKPGGTLALTTPNVEALPGRLKFMATGNFRMFDAKGDPTHITPVHSGLLPKLAERAGLEVVSRTPLLEYWPSSRVAVRLVCFALRPFVRGAVFGDCHLVLLRQAALSRQPRAGGTGGSCSAREKVPAELARSGSGCW